MILICLDFAMRIRDCTIDWLHVDGNSLRAASFGCVQYCTLFAGNTCSERMVMNSLLSSCTLSQIFQLRNFSSDDSEIC
jgi:hypothetical protein